jgi:hypothetical protein
MRRVALPLSLVGLLVAGCGSTSKSPAVASLGGAATTTSSSATAPSGGTASGGGGGRQLQMKMQGGLKFSQCMRAHGVPNFPDPTAQGGISITSASGIDPSSAAFRSAQRFCRKDLPNGGVPSPQQIAKAKRAALAFSACMRAHGLKDFPDPVFSSSGGAIRLSINGGKNSDLDPSNPTFQRAQTACGGKLGKG